MKYVRWLIIGLVVFLIPATPAYFILKEASGEKERKDIISVWDKFCTDLGGIGFYSYKDNSLQYVCMNPSAIYSIINIGDK